MARVGYLDSRRPALGRPEWRAIRPSRSAARSPGEPRLQARELQEAKLAPQTGQKRPQKGQDKSCAEDDHDPDSWGRGSYIEQMAEGEGFEPSSEGLPPKQFSRPVHSTALPPFHARKQEG
jgi:hypothetical protein